MSQPPELSVSTIAATTTTTTGCHMLKFEGYELIKRMHGAGQCAASCAFEAAGHTWWIYCYPNGLSNYAYVSLYLEIGSDVVATGAVVHAEVKFSLLPRRGRPYSKTITGVFKEGKTSLGFPNFIRREKLEPRRSGFLEDDCFAVRCDITVLQKTAVKAPAAQASDLERLGIVCDCTDDLCKRYHVRNPPPSEPAKSFFNKFLCFRS